MTGDVRRYNSADEDNFTQCGIFFREVLKEDEKERLVDNIASHLCNAQKFLQVSISKAFLLFDDFTRQNLLIISSMRKSKQQSKFHITGSSSEEFREC